MAIYTSGGSNRNPMRHIGVLIALALFFVLLYFIFKSLYTILTWLVPILLIATLLLDYKVFIDYIKLIWHKLQTNVLVGLLLVIFTIVGFPIVSAYLFFGAYLGNRMKDVTTTSKETQYIDYEIIDEVQDSNEYDEYIELSPLKERPEPVNRETGHKNLM